MFNKYKISDLYVGKAKKMLRSENSGINYEENQYENIISIFYLKNGEYIDILSKNKDKYQQNNKKCNYMISIKQINSDGKINTKTLTKILEDSKKELLELKKTKEYIDNENDLKEASNINKCHQHFGGTFTYINPYHPAIEKNKNLIKNMDEVYELRKRNTGGVRLKGVTYNHNDKIENDTIVVANFAHKSSNEPLESIVYRKILTYNK